MRPVLFTVAGVHVYPFFLTIMVGALLATFTAAHMARRAGLSPVVVIDMGIIAILASVVGSRVFHILFEYPMYYWEHPWRVFDFLAGGFVSLGAFIASALCWVWYFRRKGLPTLPYLDLVVRAVPIIIFFVRTGCLLTGCCYGRPTASWLHLVFPPGSTAYYFIQDAPVHASQIYFMINAVIAFALLQWAWRTRAFVGQVTATFLVYYGVSRFLIEFTRGDADRGVYLAHWLPPYGISTGQIVMVLFIVAGVVLYRTAHRRYPIHG